MNRPLTLALLLIISVVWALPAQNVPPALMVRKENRSEPLKVTSVRVESRIYGILAETQMTMTFYNSSNRQLAGDLYFPLPEGAAVSGYALDINGVMVDGVVVEKHKGRQVFEKIVRRGIDPGLVEWVKGNNFKTRVFPIPARGSRTVMVRYQAELTGPDSAPTYLLPLRFSEKVEDFSIRVEVIKPSSAPQVRQGSFDFRFSRRRENYVAKKSLKNARLNRDMVISVPALNRQPVLVEKSPDGTLYFSINDLPSPPPAEKPGEAPRRITIYWDASKSRESAALSRQYRLLEAWFRKLAELRSTLIVDLVVFRNEPEPLQSFIIRRGKASSLISHLKDLANDGGTQMGALPSPKAGTDLALLFSDGLSTFGKEEPGRFGVPLYIISGASEANHSFLSTLAMKNGGQYFNLNRLLDQEVLDRIGKPVYRFIRAEIRSGKIEEGYPRIPRPAAGHFSYLGKLMSSTARITLQYGIDNRVLKEASYTVSSGDAVEGSLLRLAWARKKLEDLQIYPKRNQALMVDLGKEHGLVTPGTSLIVLENLDQYVEHRIPPPDSLPEMRGRYFSILAQVQKEEREQQESKLQYILELWNRRIEWWNTTFKYPKNFRYWEEEAKEAFEGEAPQGVPEEAPALDEYEAADMPAERMEAPLAAADKAKKEAGFEEEAELAPEVAIRPWDPETPYLKVLKKTNKSSLYAAYLEQRKEYGGSPAFYLDCGDYFFRKKLPELGLRIWSNIAELELENTALLRILAHRLAQAEYLELSRLLFEEVLRLRPEEPQSYRDLALILGRLGEYEEAIELLYAVVMRYWDRFAEIEIIALMELNALIPKARRAGVTNIPVDKRLIKLLNVDVRIILTWDADLTDMDLWVTEPSGEKAYYGNRRTTIGGHFSRDFTEGYGPEEYLLKKAMKGKYVIEVNYYSSSAPSLSGSVTLQANIFTNYGLPNEKRQSITVRLRENKETLYVGDISF